MLNTKKQNVFLSILALGIIALSSCEKNDFTGDGNPGNTSGTKARPLTAGAVYVMDNQAGGNSVLAYYRAADGTLSSAGSVSTGGTGTGGGLGSQGALVRSDNYLFACNAGSDEISVFSISGQGLTWVDKVPSGGMRPISVTVHENLLYALNAGGSGNISGFSIDGSGHLSHIMGSDQPLSTATSGPAQIEFDQTGTQLVVTEKMTDVIIIYPVDASGIAGAGTAHPSVGNTPFGFEFGNNNTLIVSDAFGGSPGASALTSYSLGSGTLNLITGPVATNQTAACWVAVTNDGRYCYTTNTGSASVSGYSISETGALTLLNADGITGVTGASPIDMSLSVNSRYLYTLNTSGHSITMFRVNSDGGLTSLGTMSGLPAGSVGMSAK